MSPKAPASRRDRLKSLKDRRADSAIKNVEPPEDPFAEITGGGGGLRKRLSSAGKAEMASRQKVVMKVYQMLCKQPEGGSKMIPDTPFTEFGVTQAMKLLRERAANEGAPGAGMAGGFITFLAPADAEEPAVSGASVAKLQHLSRMATKFNNKATAGMR